MERGRLRVYLGAAPGVGKTFAMLDEGHRRAGRGTDVVVGFVETHGRPRTEQQVGGLEVVPRRTVAYRGLSGTEMDLAAVLARKPSLALVDELAHTNLVDPGDSRANPKRWQDVQVLLDAGIDVVTTVNVQHLESLNDVVESITGIRQAETVPDHVVRAAEAVELVDMSPQALRRRMAHGNIYAADKVDTALSHYFREGNLAALRELALLWLADRVDEGLDAYREAQGIADTWATRERVVTAVSGGGESVALMRRAARIASRSSSGEWLAVYVTRRDGLSGVSTDRLDKLKQAAEDIGGSFHAVVANDVADGILDFARGVNATQVLLGASRRGRVSTLLRPGIGETVIADSGDIDVHVVTHDFARRSLPGGRPRSTVGRMRQVFGFALAVLGTAALAGLLVVTPDLHGLATESLVMLSLVVATALVGGLWPALLAAVLSSVALNLLFVPPVGNLTISDPENAFALGVFVVVGAAVATVVDRAARRTAQARRARAEADALAVLAHRLLHSADDPAALLAQACEVFGMSGAAVLRRGPDGAVQIEARCGFAPETDGEADVAVALEPDVSLALRGRPLQAADRSLLTAYAAHLTVLRERGRAAEQAQRAAELAEGNRTRTALLAAVSHDLRSPLAGIKAAITSLRNPGMVWSAEDERDLLATIEESADRLDSLIGNLLDLSRLQSGAITPLFSEVDLAGVVEWALGPIAGSEAVRVTISPDLPTARADAGLLDRVVANVVENALKHTPPGTAVEISGSVWQEQRRRWVSLRVVDHGRGVPAASLDRLFAPFQRLGDVPQGDGLGLGLAVARGLTEAMGGTVSAEETPGGGLTVVIDLPAGEPDRMSEPSPPAGQAVLA